VPQETTWKCYYAVVWRGESLIAYAPSYECQLDPETGRLLAARFTKQVVAGVTPFAGIGSGWGGTGMEDSSFGKDGDAT
jgi:hypothetical protein